MQAVKTLPTDYEQHAEIDSTQDRWFVMLVNAIGLLVMVLVGWLAWRFLSAVHPGVNPLACLWIVAGDTTGLIARVIVMIVALAFVLFIGSLHEIIHGLFFWLFTRERPTFGFKSLYLYAGAPAWYLPRNQHLVVGLAPFVTITLLGVVVALVAPGTVAVWALLAVVTNAAGAGGDFAWVVWLLRQPPHVLVRDQGDVLTTFAPAEQAQ